MNELFLGFPIWYYNIASVVLSFAILAPIIAIDNKNDDAIMALIFNTVSFGFGGFIAFPLLALFLIFGGLILFVINEICKRIVKNKEKTQAEEPIEMFGCFDSNSDIKFYSIKQGENEIEIKTTSLEFVQDIKECLERSEITWGYICQFSKDTLGRSHLIAIESKIEDIKINRITNKIKID